MAWPALDAALAWIGSVGYLGLFLLMFADMAMLLHFVPGLAIAAALVLVLATSPAQLFIVYLVMSAGSLVGTCALYAVVASGGRALLERHGRLIHIDAARLARIEQLFQQRGANLSVFALRVVPVLRVFVTIPASLAHMGWRRFLLYSTPGIMLFNAGFVLIVYASAHGGRRVWAPLLALAVLVAAAMVGWRATRHPRVRTI